MPLDEFPPPAKVWRPGDRFSVRYLMRRLAAGEALLLSDRDSRDASAAVSTYRRAYPKEPGAWTTKRVVEGVLIMRRPQGVGRRAPPAEPSIFD